MIYTARQIKKWDVDCKITGTETWIPARPEYIYSFVNRLKAAFGVITGKYDVLDWEQDE